MNHRYGSSMKDLIHAIIVVNDPIHDHVHDHLVLGLFGTIIIEHLHHRILDQVTTQVHLEHDFQKSIFEQFINLFVSSSFSM
jgi:hypothetical protein